jgi:hypothetical protein
MVKPQFLAMVTKPGFRFCGSPECDVVYYHEEGEQLHKTDLRVRVGIKEAEKPALLCYCFGFTRAMLLEELRTNDCSTIPERIAAELRAGNCACELRNPQGSCCLGSIATEIKKWANTQAKAKPACNGT